MGAGLSVSRRAKAGIQGLIAARDGRLHISAIMLLRIVDHLNIQSPANRAKITEVHGFYLAERKSNPDAISYTVGGVASMLNALSNRGYLNKHREGRNVVFSLSPRGVSMLDNMYL